jgi:hypothetical protein
VLTVMLPYYRQPGSFMETGRNVRIADHTSAS